MQPITLKTDEMRGRKPDIEPIEGVYIAGGAVRQWFTGKEDPSDVDIFSSTHDILQQFKDQRLKGFVNVGENKNAVTYKKDNSVVQLIQRLFKDVPDMFDNFDYTCCQFAWTTQGIFSTKEAVISTLRNHLSIHKVTKEFAVDSLRRAFKYQNKGFEPCLGTIRDLATSLKSLTDEEIKNAIAFSPGGGSRIVRFD